MVEISKIREVYRTEDAKMLLDLAKEASNFIKSHKWCNSIKRGYLAKEWGAIVGVFLFKINPRTVDADNTVWVVVGDIPPAYIDTRNFTTADCALEGYIGAMEEWVDAVLSNKPTNGLIPVNTSPTKKFAEMLQSRLEFMIENFNLHCDKEN